jgi:hypothetical protein
MGSIIFPETTLSKNHFTLLKIPEEARSHLHHSGCLKSRSETKYWGPHREVPIFVSRWLNAPGAV